MKKIDDFINSIYKNIDISSKEAIELKEEMKNHILESMEELKKQGKSEEESINIAIERFGDRRILNEELSKMFNVKRKFEKTRKLTLSIFKNLKKFQRVIGILSLIFLILSISLFTYKVFYVDKSYVRVPKILEKEVIENLTVGKDINEKKVDGIISKYNDDLKFVAIYKIKDGKEVLEKIYPNNVSLKTLEEYYNEQTYLSKFIYKNGDYMSGYQVRFGFDYNNFKSMIGLMILICFIIYWVLFGIWAIINCYNRKKLNLLWMISFSISNIIGYLAFIFLYKRKYI